MRGDFHEAVTISAVHAELLDMDVVRKGHRLRWLISDSSVLWA